MPITYNEQSREFHLYNNKISYLIKILANEQLGQLYFGKRIPNRENQEYPAYGTTDQRCPALDIKRPNGSRITDFKYVSHKIYAGKRKLTGLPATYVENESEATTLEINLYDELIQVTLCLQYTIFENSAAIARSVKFSNDSDQKYQLKTALSLNLDLPDANYEWLQFSGAWGRERHLHKTPLRPGIQAINSARGASSHMQNPFVILKRPFTTEEQGETLGVSFVYSGNFLAQAEVDEYSVTRLQIGTDPFQFSWCLKPNETFQTPEAILAYTSEGLNQLSQTFQKLYTTRLARGYWRDKERPILINNWEATYFDFTEEKLLSIAKKAKELGIELFVLDDGWFGERTKETAGLGDWYVNRNRLKNGISGLSRKIHDLGMMFGLWLEPEMVNKDSDLYRKHPDYIIETPKRHASHGRKQYVLDFSRKEVVDNIYEQLVKILDEDEIDYIKWDMNRNITECYSIAYPPEQQGEIMHRYILGVYNLYERLIERYPKILFESCASGGGRFDAGMLYYAPQAWTSDDSDAIERLKIQYGTSFGYPQSMMGAHVSASPNEQLGRNTPLKIRGDVAFFGAFGYELDLDKLSSTELASIKKQIELMKKYRSIFQYGTFYRLKSPFEGNIVSWMVVSEDKSQAIVGYYKILNDVNCEYRRLYLPGLEADTLYNVQEELGSYLGNFTGDELANIGLVTTDASAGQNQETTDFYSKLFILERCGELSD